MSVRNFDVGDALTVDDGGIGNLTSAAFTYFLLMRPDSVAGGDAPMMAVGDGSDGPHLGRSGDGIVYADDDDFTGSSGSMGFTTAEWFTTFLTVPSGVGAKTVRFHASELDTDTWIHDNSTGPVTVPSLTPDAITWGRYFGGASTWDGKIAASAIFLAELSDGDCESVRTAASTSFLLSLSPFAAWHFNQASTSDPVLDLIGSCDETVINGTDVVEGIDPAWDFSLEEPILPTINPMIKRMLFTGFRG